MSVTAGLSESAPRIGTVTTSQGRDRLGTEQRIAGVEDASGTDRDQPRAAGRGRLLVENQPNTSTSTWADPAAPSEIRRIDDLAVGAGPHDRHVGHVLAGLEVDERRVAFRRTLAEHPQVALIGRADDGDVDGDRQHVGRRGHRPAGHPGRATGPRTPGRHPGRGPWRRARGVVDARCACRARAAGASAWYSPPAPSATAAAARPESGDVTAIDVTAEPMTRPNALTTRTQRRLIITTGGNCNGSVISNGSATTKLIVTGRGRSTSPRERRARSTGATVTR